MCFILAAILLIGTVPLTVFSAGPGIPKSLYYGGDEYTLISNLYSDSYYKATSYIAVARYGDDYFALGSDLGTVALTYSSAALSASSGVAVLIPQPNPATGGAARITDAGKMQIVGAGYLHSAGDGDLSIVQNEDETECYWCIPSDASYSLFKVYIQDEANWWNKYHGLSFDGTSFTVSGIRNDIYVYQKVCDHAGATVYEAVEPTCLCEGNLKYSYCPTCDSYVDASGDRTYVEDYGGTYYTYVYQEDSFLLRPIGHHYVDGVCVNDASHEARVYTLVTSDDMIIPGDGYRYVIVREDGKVFAINSTGQYSDDWVAESGASFLPENTLILDDSAAPSGVYGAELVIEEFVPYDEYTTMPGDGTPLFTVMSETGYSLMPMYGISLNYDPTGESKYPDGIAIGTGGHLVFRMWEYGDWMNPVFYDTAESKYDNGGTLNLYLYRCSVPAGVTGKCGENLTWTLDNGVLTVSGTGAMYDYENSFEDASLNAPWRLYSTEITTIVIEEGVTYIGSYAFTQMGLVTSVTLPDSLEALGEGAFWGCAGQTTEYDGGHYLGNENNPFIALVYTDYYLTTCTVHPNTKIIGSHAFEAQEQLTEVSIPAAVKLIGYGAFSECDALTDVYYNNTEAYWNDNVTIEGNNDALTGAAFHFSLTPATVKILCGGVELCEAEPGTVVRLPVPETTIENGGVRRFYTWGVGGKICDDVQIGAFDANNETPNHRTYTLKIGDSWWTQVGERKIELTPIYFFVGDVTGDGLVTLADLASMKSMIAGAGEYSGMAIESADVYFDGLSALSDISYMKSMLAGSYTPAG